MYTQMDWFKGTEKSQEDSKSTSSSLLEAPSRNIEKDELLKIINDHLGLKGKEIIASIYGQGPTSVLPVLERIVVLGI